MSLLLKVLLVLVLLNVATVLSLLLLLLVDFDDRFGGSGGILRLFTKRIDDPFSISSFTGAVFRFRPPPTTMVGNIEENGFDDDDMFVLTVWCGDCFELPREWLVCERECGGF